jgi:hypothetical protein
MHKSITQIPETIVSDFENLMRKAETATGGHCTSCEQDFLDMLMDIVFRVD